MIFTYAAYQSALLTTPLLLIRILASLLRFAPWMRTFFTLLLVIPSLYMAYVTLPSGAFSAWLNTPQVSSAPRRCPPRSGSLRAAICWTASGQLGRGGVTICRPLLMWSWASARLYLLRTLRGLPRIFVRCSPDANRCVRSVSRAGVARANFALQLVQSHNNAP